MPPINLSQVKKYVEDNIGSFHKARLNSLAKLKLSDILKRKNPYLFKAKHILTPEVMVRTLLDAHLSSQEETMFGDFLEGLAIFICERVHGGRKSTTAGLDLEFDLSGTRYIVAVKSGPNWGNSEQIKKLREAFKTAKKIFRTSGHKEPIEAVNGCCYGRDRKPDKGDYSKFCGQRFWSFISGEDDLYTELIEPLGLRAKEKKEEFEKAHAEIITSFTAEFIRDYCIEEKRIDWEKIVKLNSAIDKPKAPATPKKIKEAREKVAEEIK